jgi:hypothetical protein
MDNAYFFRGPGIRNVIVKLMLFPLMLCPRKSILAVMHGLHIFVTSLTSGIEHRNCRNEIISRLKLPI